ncbi:MAG: c-type cytochrome domain-containing protein [Silvanigrellaceae bacterium]
MKYCLGHVAFLASVIAFHSSCTRDPGKDIVLRNGILKNAAGQNSATGSFDALEKKATDILNKSCGGCHNEKQKSGNFGLITDIQAMVSGGFYIVPGKPDSSEIVRRMLNGTMPPGGKLPSTDLSLIVEWIEKMPAKKLQALPVEKLIEIVSKDIDGIKFPQRARDTRYFSLHAQSSADDKTLQTFRKGFFKVLNSISKSSKIVVPRAVDKAQLVFAVSIPDIGMSVEQFDSVVQRYNPFCKTLSQSQSGNASLQSAIRLNELRLESNCHVIRMDWFAATAPLPRPYSEFMQHPDNRADLDSTLGLNIADDLSANRVQRAGVQNSGVSSQNRVVERHVQANGLPYWISYDFVSNSGSGNIFENPLGPVGVVGLGREFVHDGGEVIYQLPNGLFGYYLANANGASIDKGPRNIVKQEGAPSQFVTSIVNGVSCMSCHGAGLIHKKDEVLDFALQNQNLFSSEQLERIRSIYRPEAEFLNLIDSDNKKYFSALGLLGIEPGKEDPVNDAFRLYNGRLTSSNLLEELQIEPGVLSVLLATTPFSSDWFSLQKKGGFITRDAFQRGIKEIEILQFFDFSSLQPVVGDYVVTSGCMEVDPVRMDACFLRSRGIKGSEPVSSGTSAGGSATGKGSGIASSSFP